MATTRMIKENICEQCSNTFHPWASNPSAQFCTQQCRATSRRVRVFKTCETCGNAFDVQKNQDENYNVRFCSRACKGKWWSTKLTGSGAPWYKGGWINSNGYHVISVNSEKYLEHRYVVEQHIGRKLRADEAVHHINGDKLDNDIGNLRVMSYSDHMTLHWRNGHYDGRIRYANGR